MYEFIYCRPLWQIYAVMAALLAGWTAAALFLRHAGYRQRRAWRRFNALLLAAAIAAILWGTLLRREEGECTVIWQVGSMIKSWGFSSEALRLLVMNVFLFLPFGLSLTAVLGRVHSPLRRLLLTTAAAFLLSSITEQLQHHFGLGVTELDDILCNTFGGLLGALPGFAAGREQQ